MLHLVVEADDCLRVDEFLGHYQVEARDLVERILTLFSVQATDLVVQTRQADVRGAVQAASRSASTPRILTQAASLPTPRSFVRAIEESREELLAVADGNDSFSKAVVLIDKVDLLVDAQAWTRPNVHLVPRVRRQMRQAQAPRTRHVQL